MQPGAPSVLTRSHRSRNSLIVSHVRLFRHSPFQRMHVASENEKKFIGPDSPPPQPFSPAALPLQKFLRAMPYVINRRHSSSLQVCPSRCTMHRTPRGSLRHFIIHLTPRLLFFSLLFFPVWKRSLRIFTANLSSKS